MHERRPAHRPVDAQFTKRTVEAIEMPAEIDDVTMAYLTNFVDAVRKLITAILDMDAGVGMRHVGTVDIGNSRHGSRP
ncbi:hypothetical protein D9M72_397990 [compost metagenome]